MTTFTCPAWCTEHHDHRETMTGSADHARAFLHDLGGAFVALHRLDPDGDVRVWVDPGPERELRPEAARRLAMAILRATHTVAEGDYTRWSARRVSPVSAGLLISVVPGKRETTNPSGG